MASEDRSGDQLEPQEHRAGSVKPPIAYYEFTRGAVDAANALMFVDKSIQLVRLPFPEMQVHIPHHNTRIGLIEMEGRPELIQIDWRVRDDVRNGLGAMRVDVDGVELQEYVGPENYYKLRNEHFHGAIRLLAFLNMRGMTEVIEVDNTRLNVKRVKLGRDPIPNRTVVRPSAIVKQYLQWLDAKAKGEMPEHWVGGHFHHYWHGPRSAQELRLHWIAPYQKGDAANGVRDPNYVVR